MIKNLKYDFIRESRWCIKNNQLPMHPQHRMEDLGLHYTKSEPCPLADGWFFRVDNYEENMELPEFIIILSDEFRFADEYK